MAIAGLLARSLVIIILSKGGGSESQMAFGGLSMDPAVWHEYMKTSDVGRGQAIHDTC